MSKTTSDSIRVHGRITPQEYARLIPHLRRQWLWLFVTLWVIAALAFLIGLMGEPLLVVFALVLAALSAAGSGFLWRLPRSMRAPIEGVVDESGVHLRGPRCSGPVPWGAYTTATLEIDLVVLHGRDGRMWYMTRSLFGSDADWRRYVAMVSARVPTRYE
jgi:hypothetical protein